MNLSTCTTLETIAAMLQQESQGYRTIDFLSHAIAVAQQCRVPLGATKSSTFATLTAKLSPLA
jgi:hypothetical protein